VRVNQSSIAALGDVTDVATWSGIPFHFWQASCAAGFAAEPWRLHFEGFAGRRLAWNLVAALRGRGVGGYQYSADFLDRAEARIPRPFFSTDVLTFHQHFPRSRSVIQAGGKIVHYIDAPFSALSSGRGLDLRVPPAIREEARALERENFALGGGVATMARWAAEEVVHGCGVPREKVCTILPGASVELPPGWDFPVPPGRPGRERDFVLGFVGADWRRKGLGLVLDVRDELARRGWKAAVHAAGHAPPELKNRPGMRFAGFIDKSGGSHAFLDFLAGCDLGCLFSEREALGISTLEFLRAGVPVAGFAHEGPADTLPPDAGFRFDRGATCGGIADALEACLADENRLDALRRHARRWSPLLTWERCVRQIAEWRATGAVRHPVELWKAWPENPIQG
jgi:glycosyltransferase involved in cell wall biosynthesis